MSQEVFNRIEKKYLLDKTKTEELIKRISDYIKPGEYPYTKICNIYYDTENNELIRKSIEKPIYKEKINIDDLIKEIALPYKDFAQMQEKKINLDLQYNKEINIDRNKINQLLVIVLDNAIKYTAENDNITVKLILGIIDVL